MFSHLNGVAMRRLCLWGTWVLRVFSKMVTSSPGATWSHELEQRVGASSHYAQLATG